MAMVALRRGRCAFARLSIVMPGEASLQAAGYGRGAHIHGRVGLDCVRSVVEHPERC